MKTTYVLISLLIIMALFLVLRLLLHPSDSILTFKEGRAVAGISSLMVAVDHVVKAGKIDGVQNVEGLIRAIRDITHSSEFAEDDRFDPWGEEILFRMVQTDGITFIRIECASRPWYGAQLVYRDNQLLQYRPLFAFRNARENARINEREIRSFHRMTDRE